MSMLHLLFAIMDDADLDAGNGGAVQQIDGVSPYDSTVGIRFNTDGTVETGVSKDGAAISWSPHGSWIDPVAAITGNEEVRFTNFNGAGGGDWTSEAAADDTWIALTAQRTWTMNSTTQEEIDFTCDFEVRDTSTGRATATVSYTFDIDNTA